ncbi:hemagglutinin repeat-containing protein [Pseudomonas solani]|uniref:two-partner secretion domain-containing protein n=1 Tax=Pseudomonas solani TaxID=2731552 RepID=UPI0035BE79A1
MDVRSPFFQNIATVLIGVMFLNPIVSTAADLAVDAAAGGNTSIGAAANGVPVVNIATPNGNGLSHNTFSDYNVGEQGLILNNATGKTQSTQLGGYILGNPNLNGRAAGVILNEVTGTNPSQLKGYSEVAGQGAHVIVANPHGITCDGCGFINTPRATLSTGAPVIENGALKRYDVDGGQIRIEGQGLNASNVDQFELITRSAQINAELHARQLALVTGRNDVDAATLAATAKADDGTDKPQLAIDSSALGGMYAGAIRLVGTEQGVGVKLAGDMAASAGDIQIDANGKLTLSQASAAGDLQIRAEVAEIQGAVYAKGRALLETQGDMSLRQSLAANHDVRLSSGGRLLNLGVVEAGVSPDSRRNGQGDVEVRAREVRNSGSLVADRNLKLHVIEALDNQGGTLSAQGNARVSADRLDNRRGRVLSQGELAVKARTLDNRQSGLMASDGRLDARLGRLDNRSGELSGGTRVDLRARSVDNQAGKVLAKQVLDVSVDGALQNQGGTLGAGQQLRLKAETLDNSLRGQLASQGGLEMRVAGALDNSAAGQIRAEGNAKVAAGTLSNRQGGQLTARASLGLTAGHVDNRNAGRLASDGVLDASVGRLDQRGGGQLHSGGDLSLDLNGGHLQNSGGLIRSPGHLLLRNLGEVGNQGGEIASAQSFELVARSLDNTDGKLLSEQSLTLRVGQVLASLRGRIAARTLELSAAHLNNQSGILDAQDGLELWVAGELDNQRGEILATDGRLQVGSLNNRKGAVLGDTHVAIDSTGAVDNREGRIASVGGLGLSTSGLDNAQGGRATSNQAMSIVAAQLDNRGGTLSSRGKASLSGTSLDNREGGQVVVGDDLHLFFDRLDNSLKGLLSSLGSTRLEARQLVNTAGRLYARQGLSLLMNDRTAGEHAGRFDNSRGVLMTDGRLLLRASAVVNQGGVLASAADASISSSGAFDNRGGQLLVDKHLRLTTGGLDNSQAGQIGAQGTLGLSTGSLDNQGGGRITSKGQLDLGAQHVNNTAGGRIFSSGALVASISGLDQAGGGQLYSGRELSLDLNGGYLQNSSGLIHAPGQLLLKNLVDVSNRGGEISSHTAFTLVARSLDNSGGKLLGAQALSLRIERALQNLKGQIAASTLDVQSAALDNRAGLLSSRGELSLAVSGQAHNREGEISGGGLVRLRAGNLDNQNGEILGEGGLALSVGDALDNRGGTVSGQRVALDGKRLDNRGGTLAADGPLVFRLERLDNSHQGQITSKADLAYQGQHLDNQGGRIISAGVLSLEAEEVRNASGRIASQGDLHAAVGTLAQQGGALVAQGRLGLVAQSLDNRQGGLVGSTAGLTLEIKDIDNRGGELSSQAGVSLSSQRLDNSSGKVLSGKRLLLAVDRVINQAKGLIFGRHATTLESQQLDNRGGTLSSAGALLVTLATAEGELDGVLSNQQGVISGDRSLDVSANRIDNQEGTLSSGGRLAVSSAGRLDNQSGLIVSDGTLQLSSASLDNGLVGDISARGDARLTTGTFGNSQGGRLAAAGTLELEAGQVDNSSQGRIASGGPLIARVSGLDQHDGGELFSDGDLRLDLQHGLLNNDQGGLINSPGQLLLQNLGQVSNRGGEISSQQHFTLAAERLDNEAGKLLSQQSLVLRITQALDNVRGSILANGLELRAGRLDSRSGLISSRDRLALDTAGHLDNQGGSILARGNLALAAATLDNRAGEVASQADVRAKIGTLDQRGGQLVALGTLVLSGQHLDNRADGLIGATQGLSLEVDEIDNRVGEISSQGGVILAARALDNSEGGRLLSGSRLDLVVQHLINQARGLIAGTDGIGLRGSRLDNQGGRLVSQRAVAISVDDTLANGQGLISAEGRLDLDVGYLDNHAGSLSSGGALVISSQAGLNNDEGQLISDAALSLTGAHLENRRGVLSAKGPVQVATGNLDNSQGRLTSASTLQLDAGPLINNAGRIGSGEALEASVTRLEQQGGQLFSNARLSLDLNGGDLDNREGLINAPGQLLLKNLGDVSNQGGEISSQQAFILAARRFDNHDGKLLSAMALTLRIERALANLKGLIAGSRVDLRTSRLDNTGGTLTSRSDTRLHVGEALANGEHGLISAARELSVETSDLDNRGGSLLAGSSLELHGQDIDNRDGGLINSQGGLVLRASTLDSSHDGEVSAQGDMDLGLSQLIQHQGRLIGSRGLRLDLDGGDLDNQGGLILARGPLCFERLRDLANQGGEISSHQSFALDLRHLDNTAGKLITRGQLGLAGTTLINQGGLLSGWQGLSVRGQSLDNRHQGTLSSRDGDLSVILAGTLHNSVEGALVSQGRLSLKATKLDNSDRGILSSGVGQRVEIAESIDNRAGGSIDSGAGLELRTAQLNNAAGSLHAQGPLDLTAYSIDNQRGSLTGGDRVTLHLLGSFGNAGGTLASTGALLLQGASRVDNQGGQIVSQSLLTLLGGSLDNSSRGTLAANGALLLSTSGAVQNDKDGLIHSREAGVRIESAGLTNTYGSLQAQGDLGIVTGELSNQGGRLLSLAGNLDITADTLDNRAGTLASLQGWVSARLGGWLNNGSNADRAGTSGKAGIIQGRSLALAASSLFNQGGHLSALAGDAQLAVGHLDNRQGGLFAAGLLRVEGDSLTNWGQIAGQRIDFSLAGALDNQAGILESDSTLSLRAGSLDNRGGQLRALGNTGAMQLAVGGLLDNRNGQLESANLDFGLAAGSLLNEGGSLLHVGDGVFDISLPNVGNAGGRIVTQGGLTLNADSWTNSAVIQAGRLTVNVGNFQQTATGQLLASQALTGSGSDWRNDGLIASDGGLVLSLSGTYSGSGRVTSLGALDLAAGQLTLPTTGRITSGGSANVKVGKLLANHGVLTSSGGLRLDAGQLDNHGTLGSGEVLRLTTSALLNERGLLFSGDDMTLHVTSLKNRFADIYSLGSLSIAANDSGARSAVLENISATLESARDMKLAVTSILNRKDVFSISERLIAGSITFHCYNCKGRHFDLDYFVNEEIERTVTSDSAASSISAGRNLTVSSDSFDNQHSLVSASGDVYIDTALFNNAGAATESIIRSRTFRKTDDTEPSHVFYGFINGALADYNKYNARYVHRYTRTTGGREPQTYILRTHEQVTSTPNPHFNPSFDHKIPDRFYSYILASSSETSLNTGVAASAIIQAGGNVTIKASTSLGNGVSRSNVAYAGGASKVSDTSVAASAAGNVVLINAQLPPDLAQKQVNPLALPGFSIPNGQNGLFRLSSTASTDAKVVAEQGQQSWTVGSASISVAQRQQHLQVSGGRFDVQLDGSSETGSRELNLRQHLSSGAAGENAAQVGSDGLAIDQTRPGRTQSDALARVPAMVPHVQPDRIDPPGVDLGDGLLPAQRPPVMGELPAAQPTQVQPQTPVGTQSVARVQELPATGIAPQPHRYLIETNPELTQLRQFLSSDYLLGLLGYDPDKAQKRLGDGLYEQRLVREAITARTGQRYLAGLGSDEAMFRYLMDNAIASKQSLNLSLGVSLSAAQVAALTHDIVWLEEHEVNGERVLVPVFYLAQTKGRLAPNGALIHGQDVTLISGGELVNQGTLRAGNNLSASAGNIVNSGLAEAGSRLDLLATDSIRNAQGGIIAGRDISVIAVAGDIINERSQGTLTTHGISARQDTVMDSAARIEAANDLSLTAGRDLANIGSVISAGGSASLTAGRDLLIGSATEIDSAQGQGKRSRWSETTVTQHGSDLHVGGKLKVEAGRDLAVIASRVEAGGDIALAAGRDLDITSAANESHYEYHSKRKRKQLDIERDSVRQQGSEIISGGDLKLTAGNDLSLTASRLEASNEAYLYAGNDLSLLAAEDSDYASHYSRKKKSGAFSSSTKTRYSVDATSEAQGSLISANTVDLRAQNDMRVHGSDVVSTEHTSLQAGRDIDVRGVTESHYQERYEQKKKSGLMSSGGIGITLGSSSLKGSQQSGVETTRASTVGSIQGDVSVQAGRALDVTGSDVVAGRDIRLSGQEVTISAAENNNRSEQRQESKKSGLTLALSGAVGAAANTAYETAQAARDSEQSGDSRMAALQGVKAGLSGYQAWQAAEQGGMTADNAGEFVGISVSLGTQKSSSKQVLEQQVSQGSNVNAGRDLSIQARGAEGQGGDLTVVGSGLKAGRDLTLDAAQDIHLDAAANTQKLTGSNKSGGGNVGISLGVSDSGIGLSIFANANTGLGMEKGSGTTWEEAKLDAGNQVKLSSGRDATLQGAQVSGERIVADIGRDLILQSQQDSDRFDAKQQNVSAGGSFTFGSMTGSGYVSVSQSKLKSRYDSVQEQTGLFAGEGGYQIDVGQHTQLDGAVIGSTADADKNRLSTGTLGWSDIRNKAEFSSQQQSAGISSSGTAGQQFLGNMASGLVSGLSRSGEDSSSTRAAVSEGQIDIRDAENQQQDVASLNRDVEHAHQALSPIFDKEKEQRRLREVQAIAEVGTQVMDIVRTEGQIKAIREGKEALERQGIRQPGAGASAEERDAYQKALVNSQAYKDAMAPYGTGGDYQRAAQAVTAALQGLAGGNISAAVAGAAAPYVAQTIKQATGDNDNARLMAHAVLAAVVAKAQGNSAAAGAVGAVSGELMAELIAKKLYSGTPAKDLSEEQKQTVSALSTLAAGLTVAAVGGDVANAVAGAQSGRNAVENNLMSPGDIGFWLSKPDDCDTDCKAGIAQQTAEGGLKVSGALTAAAVGGAATAAVLTAARAGAAVCASNPALCVTEASIWLGELAVGDALPTGLVVGAGAKLTFEQAAEIRALMEVERQTGHKFSAAAVETILAKSSAKPAEPMLGASPTGGGLITKISDEMKANPYHPDWQHYSGEVSRDLSSAFNSSATPGGRPLTIHAFESLSRHGFKDLRQVDNIIDNATHAITQRDGAIVFVQKTGVGSKARYNLVVEGEKGVVTGMRNFTKQEVKNMAHNQGWEELPF